MNKTKILNNKMSAISFNQKYHELINNYDPQLYLNTTVSLAHDLYNIESMKHAGRLVIFEAVRVAGNLKMYIETFKHYLSDSFMNFVNENMDELQEMLDENEELNYYDHDFFSASVLVNTYLLKPYFGAPPSESPLQMYLRVASHLHAGNGMAAVKKCFFELAYHLYTPASPTLFNAGCERPQGSSCFLLTIDDSIEGLLGNGVHNAGVISQHKGGIGFGLSSVRHSAIRHRGMSSGVVPFMRIIDKVVASVNQGGVRQGAGTAFLNDCHIDIKDFIASTGNFKINPTQRVAHLNTCVWLHNLFMERIIHDETWTAFCPAKTKEMYGKYGVEFEENYLKYEKLATERELEFEEAERECKETRIELMKNPKDADVQQRAEAALKKRISAISRRIEHTKHKASELLTQMIELEINSGFPYTMNGDSINAKSNQANVGAVNSSNLCLEVTEVTDKDTIATCNLSSVSLKAFAKRALTSEEKTRLAECLKGYYQPLAKGFFDKMSGEFIDSSPLAEGVNPVEVVGKAVSIFAEGAYDFKGLGAAVSSMVENLNALIDTNYYPVEDKTKRINVERRPIGIGVSGFDDAVKILDLIFESSEVEALNKGIFACMYYHAILSSVRQAEVHGEYPEFRTGSFWLDRATFEPVDGEQFSPPTISTIVEFNPKITREKYLGSPLANGFFQFDLWQRSAGVTEALGRLRDIVYRRTDDVPVEPVCWGDEFSWNELRTLVKSHGVRNSLLIALMPTATTSSILGNAETVEVHSSNIYSRSLNSGHYVVVNRHLVKDLHDIGLWDKNAVNCLMSFEGSVKYLKRFLTDHGTTLSPETADRVDYLQRKYKTMFEISQRRVLRYARQRGPYICQAASTNVFIPDVTQKQMKSLHVLQYKLGAKSCIYYLRSKADTGAVGLTLPPSLIEYREKVLGKTVETSTQGPVCRMEAGCLSCD